VLESINLLMSSKGALLRSDVQGKIVMKTYLTGMPECKFGLNDKLMLDKDAKAKGDKGCVLWTVGWGRGSWTALSLGGSVFIASLWRWKFAIAFYFLNDFLSLPFYFLPYRSPVAPRPPRATAAALRSTTLCFTAACVSASLRRIALFRSCRATASLSS
jgi:hypothetical protein